MEQTGDHSFGTTIRWHDLNDVGVGEVSMPRGLRLSEHAHDSAQVCFILEGHYLERWRGGDIRLGPGSTLFRPPSLPHENEFRSDGEVLALVVSFAPGRFPELSRIEPSGFSALWFRSLRFELEAELQRGEPGFRSALEALVILLSIKLARFGHRNDPPPWISEAVAFIDRSYDRRIGLETVADQAGVGRSTLSAGFRRWVGRSVGEEIRRRRLLEAERLLVETNEPIAKIAHDCGFFDQAHLTRALRAASKMTPGALRRRARQR